MNRSVFIAVLGTLAIALGALILSQTVSAQQQESADTAGKKPSPARRITTRIRPGFSRAISIRSWPGSCGKWMSSKAERLQGTRR